MAPRRPGKIALQLHPLTAERWPDLEALFGERGACGGCWCMYWRLARADFERGKGAGNRRGFQRLVKQGQIPGILAYADGVPVGWCAVEPRDCYPRLEKSRVLRRIDEQPVWSVTCFFIKKEYRGRGVSVALLRAAVAHVAQHGGTVVEGYPVEPRTGRMPGAFAWTGLASAFKKAGFVEVARGSEVRPIMRLKIGKQK
jgi:GNAT superfamily N-acetyltransferase